MLVRRIARDQVVHLVEIELLRGPLPDQQVTAVNGIERPAEQTYAARPAP